MIEYGLDEILDVYFVQFGPSGALEQSSCCG